MQDTRPSDRREAPMIRNLDGTPGHCAAVRAGVVRRGVALLAALCVWGVSATAAEPAGAPIQPTQQPVVKERSFLYKTLMYVPNRVLDLVDIFRFRVRVGPGLAANVRATQYLNGYAGSYKSVYAGLPGPRSGPELRSPVGREDLKGLMLVGVDATDDTPHHPGYSPSEFNVGVHALVVGAEAGIDPVQIGDFLAGFIGWDPSGDDR